MPLLVDPCLTIATFYGVTTLKVAGKCLLDDRRGNDGIVRTESILICTKDLHIHPGGDAPP